MLVFLLNKEKLLLDSSVIKIYKDDAVVKEIKCDNLGNEISIDITSNLKSKTTCTFAIELYNDSNEFKLKETYSSSLEIHSIYANENLRPYIYIEEDEPFNEQNIVNIKEYNIGNGGTTSVNVKNGEFTHEIPLTTISHNSLDVGISAIFDSKDYDNNKDYFMGKGWRTNLHQFLVKSSDYDNIGGCKDVAYIDAQGVKHILHEKWYYLDDNLEKVYVDRSNVFIDSDKKLKVLINNVAYEVKYDVKSDEGLSLMSGSSLSEYISKADLKATPYFKIKFKNGYVDNVMFSEQSVKITSYYYIKNNSKCYCAFSDIAINNGNYYYGSNLLQSELYIAAVKFDENGYYFENKDANKTKERLEIFFKYNINQTFEDIYFNEDIQQVSSNIKTLENSFINLSCGIVELNQSLDSMDLDASIKEEMLQNKDYYLYNELFNEYYSEDGLGYKALQYLLVHTLDSLNYDKESNLFDFSSIDEDKIISNKSFTGIISNQLQLLNNKITIATNKLKESLMGDEATYNFNKLQEQIKIYETRLNEYKSEYLEYQKQLIQLKERKAALIEEQKRKVNDFIVDKNGNTLGFDGYGRLILVTDSYENKLEVTYGYDKDNKDQLLSVSSETQTIKFEYNNSKNLKRIITSNGNIISLYVYDNLLTDIKSLTFNYETGFKATNELLESIELSKNGNGDLLVETKVSKDTKIGENTISINSETQVDIKHHYVFELNKTNIYDSTTLSKSDPNSKETLLETISFDLSERIVKDETNNLIALSKYKDDKLTELVTLKPNPKVYKEISLSDKPKSISEEYDLRKDQSFVENGVSLLPQSHSLGLLLEINNINNTKVLPISLKINTANETNQNLESYTIENPECYCDLLVLPILINPTARKLSISGTIIYDENINFIQSMKLIALEDYEKYYYVKERLINEIKNCCNIKYSRSNVNNRALYKTITNIYGETVRTNYTYDNNNHLTSEIDSKGNVIEYYYDDKGNCIEKRSYNTKDASLMRVEKVSYDDKGRVINSLGQIKDENGNYPTKEISYLPNSNVPVKVKNYNNESTCYNYNFKTGELLSISSSINGVNNATNFTYNFGLLTSMSHHGVKVNYEYDGKGRVCNTLLNGKSIVRNTYVEHFDYSIDDIKLEDSSYVTSEMDEYTITQVTDKNGLLRCMETALSDSKGKVINTYNDDNQLVKVVNGIYGFSKDIIEVIKNEYDGQLLKQVTKSIGEDEENQTNQFVLVNTYDENKRFLLSNSITFSNTNNYSWNYTYNDEHQITEITINGKSNNETIDTITTKYELDALNRISHQVVKLGSIEICNEYNYLKQDENSLDLISEEVTKIKTTKNNVISYGLDTNSYKYDVNGNIISIINDDYEIRYQYDKCNRLIREDNPLINKTIIYKYDNSGNILLKKNYAYSEDEILHNPKVDEYIYDCEIGLDHLIRYNGLEISYDTMGRPVVYKGNKLTWNSNGELLTYDNIKYSYDINSIRTKKVFNGETHNYVVNGTQILQETIVKGTSTTTINYHYILNKLVGFTYNKDGKVSNYIYRRNLQGDIIGIYDSLGNEVGGYAYDAYGKCYVKYNDNSSEEEKTILNTNPFRYRGYYYDNETQLYWVSSRYYSPELCRWISPDSIEYLDPESINGLNLYAYCGNDPVMYSDGSGHSPEWWQWALSVLSLAAGIACCIFVPGGQVFGVGLIVNGASGLISNTMDAMGVDGKTASIISAGLSIVSGIALCCIPIGGIAAFAGIGAGLIGQGVGSIAGGYISEALGGSFELGAAIGGIAGSIAGGFAYRGIMSYKFSHMTAYQKGTYAEKYVKAIYGNKVFKPTTGANRPDLLFNNGSTLIEVKNVASQSLTSQLNRYLNLGYGTTIIYVRVGTRVSSALKASSYVIKYLPW